MRDTFLGMSVNHFVNGKRCFGPAADDASVYGVIWFPNTGGDTHSDVLHECLTIALDRVQ